MNTWLNIPCKEIELTELEIDKLEIKRKKVGIECFKRTPEQIESEMIMKELMKLPFNLLLKTHKELLPKSEIKLTGKRIKYGFQIDYDKSNICKELYNYALNKRGSHKLCCFSYSELPPKIIINERRLF